MRDKEKPASQLIEELIGLRRRLSDIEELAHLGSWSWTVATGTVEWSDEVYRIFGLERDSFEPNLQRVIEHFHPEDRRTSETVLAKASADSGGFTFGARIIQPDGEIRHVISTAAGHFESDGTLIRISGTVQDITDRKQAESDLARICEMSQDLICIAGASGYFKYVNPAWRRLLGYSESELLSRPFLDFIHPDDHDVNDQEVTNLLNGRRSIDYENRYMHKNGTVRTISWSGTPMVNRQLFYCIGRDITERKRAEQQLRESERRYALVVEGLNDGLVDWNIEANTVYYSDKWKAMLGLGDLDLGDSHKVWEERFHPDDAAPAWEAVQQYLRGDTAELRLEHRLRHRDGTCRWVLARGICVRDKGQKPLRLVVSHTDITGQIELRSEKKKLQEQLQQSQKLEAIGRLAGGVAHDFNNLLTVIHGYSEMVFEALDVTDPLRRDMTHVQKAAESAAALTQQLLAFSRKQLVTPKLIDLNRTVATAEKMIRRTIGENIELSFIPGDELWKTKIDPVQVDQIIVNLALNARDAMPGNGTLTMETANVTLDTTCCHHCLDAARGEFVRLTIRDTGEGMDEDLQKQIFEPFFTTKGVGQGSGLGLSTITGIVHQAGGHIMVESAPGQGTTFTIHLPRTAGGEAKRSSVETGADPTGSETCLMVEDKEDVRDLAVRALRSRGYTVLEAESGIRALEKVEKHADEIDLLITDVVMPGMNGKQLYDRIRRIKPDVQVLYMSGYDDNTIAHHGVLESANHFLHKPFRPQELARRVRSILDTQLPEAG